MAAHILRMSDADTVRFLDLYQNEPILWDPSMDEYKNRECRAAATTRIAFALGINGFTEAHVLLKFKNLRSSYSQELKKIAESKKSGCFGKDVYVPKVIWFKVMDAFLKPHVKSRRYSNLEENDVTLEAYNPIKIEPSEHDSLELQLVNQCQPSTSNETSLEESDAHTTHVITNNKRMRPETPTTTKKMFSTDIDNDMASSTKKKKVDSIANIRTSYEKIKKNVKNAADHNDDLMAKIATALKQRSLKESKSTTNSISKEDTFDYFGKYVASLLRGMPEISSSKLQIDIVTMILKSKLSSSSSVEPSQCSEVSEDSCAEDPDEARWILP